MAARTAAFSVIFGLAAVSAAANETAPLSAIDWLSNSVELEVAEPAEPDEPIAAVPEEIRVLPLDATVPDNVGVTDGADIGLDPGLWGRSSAAVLARSLAALPVTEDAPPSLERFVADLIGARLDPPIDAVVDDSFFLARIDKLLALGHLNTASVLIEEAGATDPQRFRRAFDIALLNGTETHACRIVEETPDLSPTYPARIFCLARLGQWDVAALTLGNAETLGILTPQEDALLLHFLDPELFEGEPLPQPPRVPSPLLFRLYEAVGERIPTDPLPIAFARADLSDTVGWKARLRAAERLTAAGSLPFESMLEVYQEREPAASGGVFDRVEALQTLLQSTETQGNDRIVRTLPSAWIAAKSAGYEAQFARWIAPLLGEMNISNQTQHLAFEIALLAGEAKLAANFANTSTQDQFLLALAEGRGVSSGSNPLNRAVIRGLSAFGPGATYDALIRDDRQGEALMRALSQLSSGAAGNPDATARSLALLRKLGLEALARQLAVELVLMEGAA